LPRLWLAAFLSGWIFVVPEDEFGDEIAWRGGGWHERLGGHFRWERENFTFGLRGGGYLLHEGLQLGAWLGFTCWLLDKDTKL